MIYLAYTVVLFYMLRFCVATVNIIFSPVLKKRTPQSTPLVSVLIPARNEEANIGNILNDLIKQSYLNIEVVVFNDQSTDNTAGLVKSFSETNKRFRLVESTGLPNGWLGKNNACHNLARNASGDYFLFLDADVRILPGVIESSLAQMQKHRLKLLSIFPKQIMKTTGEKITVPVMNSILLSLLPMVLTRKSSRPSLAAANGQFMLFEKETYLEIQPHEKVKKHPVEDILIARMYKSEGLKMQCMTGNETISCRMYQGFDDAIQGFAKNVAEFFGGSHLAAFLYWLFGTFGIFVVLFFLPPVFIITTLVMAIALKIFVSVASKQSVWQNLFLAIPQQLLMGGIVFLSYLNKKQKKNQWKGRDID